MNDEIKILITGDYCPINRSEAFISTNKYDQIYNDLKPILDSNDLCITNLECPLTKEVKTLVKTGPNIKADPKTVELIKAGNFNLVTLANNHIMDYGKKGLKSTFNILKENSIEFVGAGNTLKEAIIPFTKSIKGKRIAILNIAENEFSTTHGNYPGANPLSIIENFSEIKKAKIDNDIVIVIYHGGNEEYNLPSPRLKETLRFFVDAGASVVIVHHSHRFSGYEIYRESPIFYGIGNFIFDYPDNSNKDWQIGLMVQLKFLNEQLSFEIFPISQFDNVSLGVRLLTDSEYENVINKIDELNKVILDDAKLKTEFDSFIQSKIKQYQHFIEPHTIRLLHGLMGRGFIPSFLSKKKRLLYLNLIRCEAHRDVLLEILKNENSNS